MAPHDVRCILVGNKCDEKQDGIDTRAKNLAESKNLPYFEVSAKTGENVDEAFFQLVRMLVAVQDNGPDIVVVKPDPEKPVEPEPKNWYQCWML